MSSPNLVLSLGIGPQISPTPSPNPNPEMSSPSLVLSLGIGPQISPTPSPNPDPDSSSQAPAPRLPNEDDDPSLALTLGLPSPRRRRHHCLSSPLEGEDLLREILVRLPPQPSSLPRASLVSKRWLGIVSDPRFTGSFLLRHRHRLNTPLLSFFAFNCPAGLLELVPTLDPPNRVPDYPWHLDLPAQSHILGNRHGLVLVVSSMNQLVVLDPTNGGELHRLDLPMGFGTEEEILIHGAVLRAADDDDDIQVVLVGSDKNQLDAPVVVACVYSSKKGAWGNLVSTKLPPEIPSCYLPLRVQRRPAILVGDYSLYWKLSHYPAILEFDLRTQNLVVIALPDHGPGDFTVMRAEGGGLGLLLLSSWDGTTLQYWKRKTDSRGVAWELGRTVNLDELIPQPVLDPEESDDPDEDDLGIQGYAESNNVVFLRRFPYLYMLQLDTLKFKEVESHSCCCHPFESVYTAGI